MGTASFSVGRYAKGRSGVIESTDIVTSGAYTTSTTASNLEDAGGDITMSLGQILTVSADEAMRIRFGGTAATASTGFYIGAGVEKSFECENPGLVSIIDVA